MESRIGGGKNEKQKEEVEGEGFLATARRAPGD